MKIDVMGIDEASKVLTSDKASGYASVISIDDALPHRFPTGYEEFPGKKLVIMMTDHRLPTKDWVQSKRKPFCFPGIIENICSFVEGKDVFPMLVHCLEGRARSPAVATIALAHLLGPGHELQAVSRIAESRICLPHDWTLAVADVTMKRQGKLYAAYMRRHDLGVQFERSLLIARELYDGGKDA